MVKVADKLSRDNGACPAWTPAFCRLQAAYEHRLSEAKRASQRGQRVVGYVGNTVPVELIIAAGCFPLRVAPVSGVTTMVDRYIENFADTDVRLIVELFVAGELDFLSLLVIPRSTESFHKLYLSIREVKRVGVTKAGPEIFLYEILHTQQRFSRDYGLARTRELALRLSRVAVQPVVDRSLRDALAATNQTRELLGRLQQERRSSMRPPSGFEAHVAASAAQFLEHQVYNPLLAEWLSESSWQAGKGPRLLVMGCPLEYADLHRLIDLAGGLVVAEDGDWGARAAAPLISHAGEALAAIFDHYYASVPCARLFPQALADRWFMENLRVGNIDGVIFYLPPPEDTFGWDFPRQRAAVEAAGLRWLLIRRDVRSAEAQAAVGAKLRDFLASLDPGRRVATRDLTSAY